MSENTDPQRFLYSALEEHHAFQDKTPVSGYGEGRGRGGATLGLASEGSDSSQESATSPPGNRNRGHLLHEDVEMNGSGTESHGNESHGNDSNGNESLGGSSNDNGKDSALLESSGSNKSSNSHSLSPPSSSNAFSLLSACSEQDHPSTSGCSSEESAKAKTQKELFKTLKDLKAHLPSEKRNKGKSSTLNTLKYALHCVKQVKANEEYYQMLMTNDSQPTGLDVSCYTIAEIDSITSEYTLKNTDIFAVAVSMTTGKIVYISDQAASILDCKSDVFKNAKFVEFLSPQDVSVFYSFTTPYRLPSWSMCTGAESSPADCVQEKSFFCRISGGRKRKGDLQYYPFRMTPYLMKVQDSELAEEQICCLLLAERVHSGYEAPRIPPDKRIFTTTHTPSCVLQDVDERAVPLLGYLPQDLIGSQMLLHLHPSDRPLMLAVHRKILQYMGQPFDHSSIRFCIRNGEYVTLDTSWSSFVNPWSRKVSFVIGRHKVRMGPVNEDVFDAPPFTEGKIIDSDIQEITEQIHRLLLQPVHSLSSSGYSSLGSNTSHEQLVSVASSSDSNGNTHAIEEASKSKPRTFQEICKDVHMLKSQEQQVYLTPSAKPKAKKIADKLEPKSTVVRPKDSSVCLSGKNTGGVEDLAYKDQTVYSYQQISCLDSVIRYLESCNIPITVKRKCQSSSYTTSSASDEDKQKGPESAMQVAEEPLLAPMEPQKKQDDAAVVSASLTPLSLPCKAESVVSITSQCSYSSTIVHVGDKKLQPESEIIEDVAESPAPPAPLPPPPSQEKEAHKKLGLTKQVLAAHTQKEEQAFLTRCRDQWHMRSLRGNCSQYLERHRGPTASHNGVRVHKSGANGQEPTLRKGGRNRKTKKQRMKKHESSDSTVSQCKQPNRLQLQGLNQTSWSLSEASQSTFPVPYPAVMPAYPFSFYPASGTVPTTSEAPVAGMAESQGVQATPYAAPVITPVMAFVLPNCVFPQMGATPEGAFTPQPAFMPVYPAQQGYAPSSQQVYAPPNQQGYAPPNQQGYAPPSQQVYAPPNQQGYAPPNQQGYAPPSQPGYLSPNQQAYAPPNFPQAPFMTLPSFPYPPPEPPKPASPESLPAPSRSPTPLAASPLSPRSRCSSPLQLNLLQLEERPLSVERQDSFAPSAGQLGNSMGEGSGSQKPGIGQMVPMDEGQHSDAHSSSSDLMDLLLQEDSRSGTGSATSGSMGSGSNGCGTSGTGSSQTSNTSKYFGSVDSSETDLKAKACAETEENKHFKYVLQEPLWLLMANADESVMMKYQLPARDMQKVLKEDRDRLRQMQKHQPCFTEDQRKELADVHPWMTKGCLPKALNVKYCMCCEESQLSLIDEDLPGMELSTLAEAGEDESCRRNPGETQRDIVSLPNQAP